MTESTGSLPTVSQAEEGNQLAHLVKEAHEIRTFVITQNAKSRRCLIDGLARGYSLIKAATEDPDVCQAIVDTLTKAWVTDGQELFLKKVKANPEKPILSVCKLIFGPDEQNQFTFKVASARAAVYRTLLDREIAESNVHDYLCENSIEGLAKAARKVRVQPSEQSGGDSVENTHLPSGHSVSHKEPFSDAAAVDQDGRSRVLNEFAGKGITSVSVIIPARKRLDERGDTAAQARVTSKELINIALRHSPLLNYAKEARAEGDEVAILVGDVDALLRQRLQALWFSQDYQDLFYLGKIFRCIRIYKRDYIEPEEDEGQA